MNPETPSPDERCQSRLLDSGHCRHPVACFVVGVATCICEWVPMNALPIAASSMNGVFVLGLFSALLIGTLLFLDRRLDPFRTLRRFRVQAAPGIRFERLAYATIGDTPTRRSWYRHTLSFAIESDSVYLRRSRLIPFFPTFWRLPREQVRRCEHDCWTVRIYAADPPLNADFGSDFVAALTTHKA